LNKDNNSYLNGVSGDISISERYFGYILGMVVGEAWGLLSNTSNQEGPDQVAKLKPVRLISNTFRHHFLLLLFLFDPSQSHLLLSFSISSRILTGESYDF
jgi:hypothetical protein